MNFSLKTVCFRFFFFKSYFRNNKKYGEYIFENFFLFKEVGRNFFFIFVFLNKILLSIFKKKGLPSNWSIVCKRILSTNLLAITVSRSMKMSPGVTQSLSRGLLQKIFQVGGLERVYDIKQDVSYDALVYNYISILA